MIRLLDLSGAFWSCWFGAAGQPPSYTYERVNGRVRELAHACDGLAICLDSPRSWRKELDPAYKATRPSKEAAAIDQLRRIIDELRAAGYPVWQADGFEADDVIASAVTGLLAMRSEGARDEIQIVTSDKDLLQLVDDAAGVAVLSLTSGDVVNEAGVVAKFQGLGPKKIRDMLAIMGDTSDNVPGVKGVGLVGARTLLQTFVDLAGVITASQTDGLIKPPGLEAKIRASLGDIDRSAQLVTLRTDVSGIAWQEVFAKRVPTGAAKPTGGFDDAGFSGDDEEDVERAAISGEPVTAAPAPAPASPPPPKSAPRAVPPAPKPAAAKPAPSTSLVLPGTTSTAYMLALEPQDLSQAYKLSRTLFDSGLFTGRSGHSSVESIFAVILTGRTMGLDALTALRGIDIIKGKPRLSSSMLVGLVLRSGLAEYFTLLESTNEKATYTTKRRNSPAPVTMTFDKDDAIRAGLWGAQGPWTTQPRTMLRWRCCSELARAEYEDVASNVYTPGELEEPGEIDGELLETGS